MSIIYILFFSLSFSLNVSANSAKELIINYFQDIEVTTPDIKIDENLSESENSNVIYIPDDLNGENLFLYLHKNTEIKNPVTYTNSKNIMFSTIDNTICPSGKNGVIAFYSRICVDETTSNGGDYVENGDLNGDGYIDSKGMNVEHIWPQSFFNQNLPMRADLHHLRPTFMKPNNVRANYPFCIVEKAEYQTTSGAKFGNGCFEPPDEVKGDVARSLFYFVMRYYDKKIKPNNYESFFTSNIELYMKWNKQDPPSKEEKERNNRIYLYQGNRNPFIDDYTLIDRVGIKVWQSY